ncbi:MAG: glycoside hydrolase family 65 protein [Butyrivibrio sp.]|nr:glycoside hydrolase family 65 protein [Butyrivibrio sp.]
MHNSNRVIRRDERYDNKILRLNETLFSNANGYIGVRGTLEEGVPADFSTMRGMYLAGVYETIPMKQAESLCNLIEEKQTMLNVADTQSIDLYICGERFDMGTGELISNQRILDMDQGFTSREIVWKSPLGNTVKIVTKRVAHLDIPQLFTIEYSVKSLDFDGEIVFDSWHIADVKNYSDPTDPRLASESSSYLEVTSSEVVGDVTLCVSRTKVSGISIASASAHLLFGEDDHIEVCDNDNDKRLCSYIKAHICQDQEISLLKFCTFSDSLRCDDPKNDAHKVLLDAMKKVGTDGKGLKDLYDRQSAILKEFWLRSGMEIMGDEDLNLSMSFNMYELFCSAPRTPGYSMAAKGLTGEGYEGHYFWDTEMYALPFFTLTDTDLAKNILHFRYKTLDKARENAVLLGHKKGALYPWRTITGQECSGYFPSGTAAYHINGAVSYAIVQYYLTTGDKDFILKEGAEILIETSRLWLDTGNFDRKGNFVINEVTGPDEYTCMVDNNFYTNCMAAHGMKWTLKLLKKYEDTPEIISLKQRLCLTDMELSDIKKAADNIYLPYDEELGINPQDDSFLQKPIWDLEATPKEEFPLLLHYHPLHLYRYQVCKQADTVLAHFLFPDSADKTTQEKSFRYYEKITTHDSSLSTCVFSMQASRLGLFDEAVSYLGDSAKLDLLNLHGNSSDGVHTANMGGSYMAFVFGFGGVKITEEGLSINPFLPGTVTGYSFKFGYFGRLLQLSINEKEMVVELISGDEISFEHKGKTYTINGGEKCSIKQ